MFSVRGPWRWNVFAQSLSNWSCNGFQFNFTIIQIYWTADVEKLLVAVIENEFKCSLTRCSCNRCFRTAFPRSELKKFTSRSATFLCRQTDFSSHFFDCTFNITETESMFDQHSDCCISKNLHTSIKCSFDLFLREVSCNYDKKKIAISRRFRNEQSDCWLWYSFARFH